MRVALFTDSDVFAGTERHILELARGLGELGCEALIACPGHGVLAGRATETGVRTLDIPKRGAVDWRAARILRRLLRAGQIDLIHAHNGRTALAAALAIASAGRGRLVATQHFIDPSRVGRRGLQAVASRILHRWIAGRVGRFIAISVAVKRAMLRRGDAADEKIVVVPNGIASLAGDSMAGAEVVQREFTIAATTPLVVCAARLEPEKDVESLAEAVALVARRFPDVCCLVAGDGSQRDSIERRVRELRIESQFRLLGFRPDVTAIMNAADIFVLPSLAEPFGLVILEAMALGKPVVATAAGGPMEIVAEGETGLLIPPRDPPALAEAICSLVADADQRRRMGEAGRKRFLEHFTSGQMAAAILAVYRQALGAAAIVNADPDPMTPCTPTEAASHAGR